MSEKEETAAERIAAQFCPYHPDDEWELSEKAKLIDDREAWMRSATYVINREVTAAIDAAVGRERANIDWVLEKIKACHPALFESVNEEMPGRLYVLMHLLSNDAGMYERFVATRRTDVGELQNEVERLQADLATQHELVEEGYRLLGTFFEALKRIEDNAAWLLRDVERNKVARTDLVAAEQRGREAERGDIAEHLEAVAQSLSLRDEQERYREIAALIRARGDKAASILPGGAELQR